MAVTRVEAVEIIRREQLQSYAEVGIGQEGLTAQAVAKVLPVGAVMHLFDYQDYVSRVGQLLRGRHAELTVVEHPNSRALLDSYNWSLARLLAAPQPPRLDYVYLDGAHTWNVDALAFLLLDRLLAVDGYIEFDDYDWTYRKSLLRRGRNLLQQGHNSPDYQQLLSQHTDEQFDVKQVAMIVDLLVKPSSRYVEIVPNRVYRKLQDVL